LARQESFEPNIGPLNFFFLEFGPLAKKVGHPCTTTMTPTASKKTTITTSTTTMITTTKK
jgi:hypothetical protein